MPPPSARLSGSNDRFQAVIYAPSGQPYEACLRSLGNQIVTVVIVDGPAPLITDYLIPVQTVTGGRTDGRRRAAERGNSNFILFIDADCEIEEPAMLDIAAAHLAAGAAVVGGLLIEATPKGMSFAAGYAFSTTGRPYYRFHGWSPQNPRLQIARDDIQAVPFHFLATRRDVFRRVGLRPEFGELPYADADYCIRARTHGPVIYEPAIRAKIAGSLIPQYSDGAVQLLLASAHPGYDEYALL